MKKLYGVLGKWIFLAGCVWFLLNVALEISLNAAIGLTAVMFGLTLWRLGQL